MKGDAKEMLFCEIAVNMGFFTKDEALQILDAQQADEEKGNKKKIGEYLIERDLLNEEQVDQILARQFVDSIEDTWGENFNQDEFQNNTPKPQKKLFCEIALKLGYITKEQANQALRAQRIDEKKGIKKKIGEYLLEMNILNKDQVSKVLSLQAVDSIEWRLADLG